MEASTDVTGAGGGAPAFALPDLTFRRVFDAPLALAFKAWTDAACVAAWWGPNGSSNPFTAVEPRPGGRFHVHMQAPDGEIQAMGGHFVEVEAPHRVVVETTLADADGNVILENLHTVTLTQRDNRTEMHLHTQMVLAAPSMLPHVGGVEEGWRQSLERLVSILKAI
jgi:uncharacterized protein YndB with AHSA1/START domain